MAARDVSLIIRAKDDASKALDTITNALASLTKGQKGLVNGANGVSAALDKSAKSSSAFATKLGTETAKAETTVKAALGKIEDAVDKSRATLSRQRATLTETSAAYGSLKAQIEAAGRAIVTAALAAKESGTAAATARLEAAQTAYRELNKEATRLGATLRDQTKVEQASAADLADLENKALLAAGAIRALGVEERKLAIQRAQDNAKINAVAGKGFATLGASEKNIDKNNRQTDIRAVNEQARRGIAALSQAEQDITARIKARKDAEIAAAKATADTNAAAARGMKFLSDAEDRITLAIRRRALEARRAAVEESAARRAAQQSAGTPSGAAALAKAERDITAAIQGRAAALAASRAEQDAANASARRGFTALSQAEAGITARIASEAKARSDAAAQSVAAQAKVATSFRTAKVAADALKPSLGKVWQELNRLGPEAQRAGDGMARGAAGAGNMRRALAAFYGDSRKALSLMQRLRGEVLSLTATFVGFYGIFNQASGFLQAFNQLQAAESRLGAAFQQNAAASGAELAFLKGEADRLGFSFDVLSSNYSKFLISARAAGIETAKIRKIFIQVAESARVLKLSNEDVEGVLTALTQIAGKGRLQMEELRQQLGDRLPGAVEIMAKSLGYGTDQLAQFYKDVTAGNISASDALVAFGNGLEQTFGGQLDQTLKNVSTKVGQLQNLFFQRQITAANAGFIDGLEKALDALNAFLASKDGIAFFEKMGHALGSLLGLIPGIIQNIDKLTLAVKLFVAIKFAQVAGGMIASFKDMTTASIGTRRAMILMNRVVDAAIPGFSVAARGAGVFAFSLRTLRQAAFSVMAVGAGLLRALGGPIGLLVTAMSFFAIDGLGGVESATSKLDETLQTHQTMLEKIQAAYLRAGEGAKDWKQNLEGVNYAQVAADLAKIQKGLAEFKGQKNFWGNTVNTVSDMTGSNPEASAMLLNRAKTPDQRKAVEGLLQADAEFIKGTKSGKAYLAVIDDIAKTFPGLIPAETLGAFSEIASKGADMEAAIAKDEAILRLLNGTATDADKVLLGLKESLDTNAKAHDDAADKAGKFRDALNELAKNVPSLKAQLDKLDSIAKIEESFQNALLAANQLPDAIMRIAAAQEALKTKNAAMDALYMGDVSQFNGTDGTAVTKQVLRSVEGFQPTGKWDRNAFRAGYGSDTVTLADGTIKAITEGMAVTVADAERDLQRRVTTEFMPRARDAVGADKFAALNAQQQAALTSLAYNYGRLPAAVAAAVKTGTAEDVKNAIQGLGGDNGGINRDRRNKEAALYTSTAGLEAQQADAEKQLQLQKDFHESQLQSIEASKFELTLADKNIQDAEVAKALRAAELEAKKAGTVLSAEERAQIEETTRAKYAQQATDDARNKSLKDAKALEENVTLLTEKRAFLKNQLEAQQNAGDVTGMAGTADELVGVNNALDEAIDKAIAFWQALGGEGSAAAIQGLQIAKSELHQVESQALTTGKALADSFSSKGAAALDTFAQAIANGENAFQALGRAIQQAAAEILIELGQMILKQALFNALSGGAGAGGTGGITGLIAQGVNAIFKHGGGIAGAQGRTANVDPAIFANAVRYHTGGIAGLAPDEVPAILRKTEEVLTESDPRHRFNGGLSGGAGAKDPTLKVVNVMDHAGLLEAALSTPRGEKLIVNHVRANANAVKTALGL